MARPSNRARRRTWPKAAALPRRRRRGRARHRGPRLLATTPPCLPLTTTYPCPTQIPACDVSELRERHLRLLDLRMPPLLPLEIVVAAIPQLHQRLDLPLYRHLARAGQHVPATTLRRRGDGVLEMHVPDVAAQLPHRVLGLFLARHECVVRVPE